MSERRRGGVTRRELLGASAAAAAASALPAAARAETAPSRYDVIVLGAGFCGITAARECTKAGLRTLVLEARGRVGGRTHTVPWNGTATDLGGTWVHWMQPHVWAEIQRYGLALVESSGAVARRMIVRRRDGDLAQLDTYERGGDLANAISAYMGDSRAMFPRPFQPFHTGLPERSDGVSAAEPIARVADPMFRDLLDGYVGTCVHNSAREGAWIEMVRWYALSAHNFIDMIDAGARYRFREGTGALIEAMLADAKPELRLGEAVARVTQERDAVVVETASGEAIAARCAISTLPLNVLADVRWEPALAPRKLEASRERHAGQGVKFHAVVSGERDVSCIAPSDQPISMLFTDHVGHGKTHMIGFGPSADRLDSADRAQLQSSIRAFLPGAEVLDATGWIWSADPHARGTWCFLRPGQFSKYLAALQAPEGRVIFASADWANGWRGFIDGAIEQGLIAARRVRALMA